MDKFAALSVQFFSELNEFFCIEIKLLVLKSRENQWCDRLH